MHRAFVVAECLREFHCSSDLGALLRDLCLCRALKTAGASVVEWRGGPAGVRQSGVSVARYDVDRVVPVGQRSYDAHHDHLGSFLCRHDLECVGYFLRRGFRCMATDDIDEAHRVCEATTPDAVVVLGTQMEDEEIELFHDAHSATEDPAPLFMFLSEGQSQRLNGHIRTPKSHVITGNMSLGGLRREIQRTLGLPDEDPETDRTNAHSETGELI